MLVGYLVGGTEDETLVGLIGYVALVPIINSNRKGICQKSRFFCFLSI